MSTVLKSFRPAPRFVDFREAYSLRKQYPDFKFITVQEYAEAFGVTARTAYTWVRKNPLKHNAQKIEGVWRVLVKA